AAQAEVDEQLAGGGENHPRSLGGDKRLEVQGVDQACFQKLCQWQRRRDAQDRLVGEEHRAFRHRVHVTGEAQRAEIVEQAGAEAAGAREPGNVLGGKGQVVQKLDRQLEASSKKETSARRQLANKELEHRRLGLIVVQVGLDHVELIKICQQRASRAVH